MGITDRGEEYRGLQELDQARHEQALERELEALRLQVMLSTWKLEEVF